MDAEELVAAVRAALDDTERLARAAAETAGETWWHRPTLVSYDDIVDDVAQLVVAAHEYLGVGELDDDMIAHSAGHDPAAVLRRVAADREILAEHSPHRNGACPVCWRVTVRSSMREDYPCPTLRALAHGLGIDPTDRTEGEHHA